VKSAAQVIVTRSNTTREDTADQPTASRDLADAAAFIAAGHRRIDMEVLVGLTVT